MAHKKYMRKKISHFFALDKCRLCLDDAFFYILLLLLFIRCVSLCGCRHRIGLWYSFKFLLFLFCCIFSFFPPSFLFICSLSSATPIIEMLNVCENVCIWKSNTYVVHYIKQLLIKHSLQQSIWHTKNFMTSKWKKAERSKIIEYVHKQHTIDIHRHTETGIRANDSSYCNLK